MWFRFKFLNDESGIIMPFVVGFLIILTTIGSTLAQTSTQTFNNSLNFSYNQIAHVASKAAIDYGEEAYELNAAYNGTAERDLHTTDRYRSTIEIEVLYDQGSSAKRIRAIGRVYVFDPNNGTADFTREIQASIIRNGAVAGNPADYEPVLWLDAGAANTLFASTSGSPGSEVVDGLYGSGNADIVEERGSDAGRNPGQLRYNADLEFSYGNYNHGHQNVGLRFRDVNVDQGETIDSAYIQFTVDETKQAGDVELLVTGVASDNAPNWSGYWAVTNATKTTASVTWQPADWNNVGEAGTDERVDITPIVQELLNRPGWSNGNSMAFSIDYVSGSGIRTAEAGSSSNPAPQLQINWTGSGGGGGGAAVNDGDPVGQWLDTSADTNDATLAYGVDGELKKAQINGQDAVRFADNTILRAALSPTISGNGITAFAVMQPASSSASNSRFVTAQNTAQTNDYGTQDSAILFLRYGTGSTLAHYYNNTYGPTLSGAVDDTWSVYSSRITQLYSERLLEDGVDNISDLITTVNYDLDEIFIGGSRSATSGVNQSSFDLAELIVYDDTLVCSEMQSVENYLGLKYNITITDKNCP